MIQSRRLLSLAVPCIVAAVFILAGIAHAQDAVALGVDSISKVASDAFHVARNWSTVGTLGGLAALSGILLKLLTAYRPVEDWLDIRGLLPIAASALGMLAGILGAVSTHGSWMTGAVEGYTAGLAAVGLHQTGKQWKAARANGTAAPTPVGPGTSTR